MGDEHWAAVSQETIPKDPYADGRKTTAFSGNNKKQRMAWKSTFYIQIKYYLTHSMRKVITLAKYISYFLSKYQTKQKETILQKNLTCYAIPNFFVTLSTKTW